MAKPDHDPTPTQALLAYLAEGHHRRPDGDPFRWGLRSWTAAEVAWWLGELEARSEAQHKALLRALRPRGMRQPKAALAAQLGISPNTLHRLVHRGLLEMAMGMGLR